MILLAFTSLHSLSSRNTPPEAQFELYKRWDNRGVILPHKSGFSDLKMGLYSMDIRWIFTRVQPRLYWGSPSVSSRRTVSPPPEPRGELLESDLGTVITLVSTNILIQNNCSFFNIFHVMWPSDSKPAADCISKLDEWHTYFYCTLVLPPSYEY